MAAWMGGFVAAEGSFVHGLHPTKQRFIFQLGLGEVDRPVCERFQTVLGVGRLVSYGRRQPHYDDEVTFVVTRLIDLIDIVVPFMDAHLPASHKRVQYEAWRGELVDYWEHQARRRRPCRLDGCPIQARAHGLCRPHLWSEMGR